MAIREKELAGLPSGSDLPRGRLPALLDRLIGPFRRGVPPQPQPATGFYTDTTVCIGCKACEVACKQWNQLPADGFHWSGNSYDNTGELSATSWRHVKFVEQFPEGESRGEGRGASEGRLSLPLVSSPSPHAPHPSPLNKNRWLMMSDVCKHCVTAPCQQACPTGALIHNEFENVYIQPDICNGCSYCVAACPFGVITRAMFDGHAHKCTLCYDRQKDGLVPACAKACPTQSIQFGPVDELRARARRRVEELHRLGETSAYLYGDDPTDTYSALHSFYILIDHPSVYGLPEKPFNPWLRMKGDYVRAVAGGLAAVAALLAVLFLRGD
ncbi:MAG TPA: 4Fe-4S dicluster domain-containing protein [Gemmataceae bacterium]|jgi:formate dehydrogenase iron-sulfur subunit|nr:4Fe-4S dicluster domain-containing protein [Gemmataceae bacterium]